MIPQQFNPETQKRPNKIGERDMRALYILQAIIARSSALANDSARRAYGPFIDMPNELPPSQTRESAMAAGAAAAASQTAETQTPNEAVSTLAASAVKIAETTATSPVASPNIDQIRQQINNALANTAAPKDTNTEYELAA